ncbi:MAG: Na/Pi cotransporter family protein [Ramlibacter sp.]|nr:Na/Pi cotransporter family protein [Ramlibacter sp.]
MSHLLNLLAAVALLVWGTFLVRTGVLEAAGVGLRRALARGMRNRFWAFASGLALTAVMQSSTAAALIVASFVGEALIGLPMALAVMLGADVGTSLVALVFSFDLTWLSPLMIFAGVFLFMSRAAKSSDGLGRFGRILIGLGVMLLALRLVAESTAALGSSSVVAALLASLKGDPMLAIALGVALTGLAYSSLAVVLLAAMMAGTGTLPAELAIDIVLGANLGSGMLAVASTARATLETRRVPLGNLIFKLTGVAVAGVLTHAAIAIWGLPDIAPHVMAIGYHLAFNTVVALGFIGLTRPVATVVEWALPRPAPQSNVRVGHLDAAALQAPARAIACAAREALHQADIVESMLSGIPKVIRENDLPLAQELRALDDRVDQVYSSIKYYLTKIAPDSLTEPERRRWGAVIDFTINMEQIADVAERILVDIEEKQICRGLSFSEAGMAEICQLHARLLRNFRCAVSVFLNGSVRESRELLHEKAVFGELQRAYASTHLVRLNFNSVQSMKTSSLHIDLLNELKRINSHICAVVYPVLERAGALTRSRLREDSAHEGTLGGARVASLCRQTENH